MGLGRLERRDFPRRGDVHQNARHPHDPRSRPCAVQNGLRMPGLQDSRKKGRPLHDRHVHELCRRRRDTLLMRPSSMDPRRRRLPLQLDRLD